jgi:hypothetical protein
MEGLLFFFFFFFYIISLADPVILKIVSLRLSLIENNAVVCVLPPKGLLCTNITTTPLN